MKIHIFLLTSLIIHFSVDISFSQDFLASFGYGIKGSFKPRPANDILVLDNYNSIESFLTGSLTLVFKFEGKHSRKGFGLGVAGQYSNWATVHQVFDNAGGSIDGQIRKIHVIRPQISFYPIYERSGFVGLYAGLSINEVQSELGEAGLHNGFEFGGTFRFARFMGVNLSYDYIPSLNIQSFNLSLVLLHIHI